MSKGLSPFRRQILNISLTVGSLMICLLLSLKRIPGMEFLGIAPSWALIWVVAWSIKRTVFQGIIGGLTLGLIQDGMTGNYPSHVFGLVLVGILSARLHKRRHPQEELIAIAFIVFAMVMVAETVYAFQYLIRGIYQWSELWPQYQLIALASALLSSLWAPVVYYPLNYWWERLKKPQKSS